MRVESFAGLMPLIIRQAPMVHVARPPLRQSLKVGNIAADNHLERVANTLVSEPTTKMAKGLHSVVYPPNSIKFLCRNTFTAAKPCCYDLMYCLT